METLSGIIASEKMVLIDFFAEWCGPCKMMPPILQQVKAKFGNSIRILKIDVDRNPKVAAAYEVQGVPTLILFKHGQQAWRRAGVLSPPELIKLIEPHQ